MPFPRRLLNDNENMVLDLHPHWWFFGPSAMWLGGVMFVTTWMRSQLTNSLVKTSLTYLGIAGIIVTAAWLVTQLVKWRTTYFVVTSHRLIYRQGVVAREGVEIPLERVNNVNFNQSIFERLIGVGDLLIESGGQEGQQTFTDIASPEKVQNIIHSTIQNRGVGRPTGAPSMGTVAEELERLEALRDRGTLSEDEFQEQKRRIID
jgi:uncharacterized membrane protein YdbT with pleckstrin-like domain